MYPQRAILQLHHWQHWLLMLADQPGATDSGETVSEFCGGGIIMLCSGWVGVILNVV